jgi:hypothetical protein
LVATVAARAPRPDRGRALSRWLGHRDRFAGAAAHPQQMIVRTTWGDGDLHARGHCRADACGARQYAGDYRNSEEVEATHTWKIEG